MEPRLRRATLALLCLLISLVKGFSQPTIGSVSEAVASFSRASTRSLFTETESASPPEIASFGLGGAEPTDADEGDEGGVGGATGEGGATLIDCASSSEFSSDQIHCLTHDT